MRDEKRYLNRDIYKIKNHIQKMFPHANEVDVKVHKLSNGEFRSSIKVFVPKKKVLIAQKRDEDVKKCLEKSHLAIVRQVHRIKTKWERRKNRHLSLVV